jgi:hypothetical protein
MNSKLSLKTKNWISNKNNNGIKELNHHRFNINKITIFNKKIINSYKKSKNRIKKEMAYKIMIIT